MNNCKFKDKRNELARSNRTNTVKSQEFVDGGKTNTIRSRHLFLSIEQFLVLIRHMFYVTYSELEVHKTELLGKVT